MLARTALLSALALPLMLLHGAPSVAQQEPPAAAAPGRLVDLGGFRLHYLLAGEAGPTVVFFHGAGDLALLWGRVLPRVGELARAVAVDEHGMGWSDWGAPANTLRQQAFDFHRLLEREGLEPPYVLVGHSRGGLVALHFVRQFRDEVAGVVLVDATHPDVMLRYRQPDGSFRWQRTRDRARDVEIPAPGAQPPPRDREMRTFDLDMNTEELSAGLPERDRALIRDRYHRTVAVPVDLRSYFAEELEEMARKADEYALGDLPLRVVSAGLRDKEPDNRHTAAELVAESERLQRDLVRLSRRGRQIVAPDSGHRIQLDAPDVVVRAIREVLEEARLVKAPRLP